MTRHGAPDPRPASAATVELRRSDRLDARRGVGENVAQVWGKAGGHVMPVRITKVDVWAGQLEDQPGGLARVLEALADGGARLQCCIARRQPDKPGTGVAFVTPVSGARAEAAARAA